MHPMTPPATDDVVVPFEYVTGARGHVVLSLAADGVGTGENLAVWKLAPTGWPVGAWVLSLDGAPGDLLPVLRQVRGCCLVDWTVAAPAALLDRIAPLLPADMVDGFRHHVLDIPSLLDEIREQRRHHAAAVEEHRSATKSKILPLEWHTDLPGDSDEAARMVTPVAPADAPSAVARALAVAGAVRRVVALWQDTEQVRCRRSYLRSAGEPQALPPRWLARLRLAATPATWIEVRN